MGRIAADVFNELATHFAVPQVLLPFFLVLNSRPTWRTIWSEVSVNGLGWLAGCWAARIDLVILPTATFLPNREA